MNLLKKQIKPNKKIIYINIARVKKIKDEYLFSLSLPCLNCRKKIIAFCKYRKQKYNQNVLIRYTTNDGTFTKWYTCQSLPESKLSSGWKMYFNSIHS